MDHRLIEGLMEVIAPLIKTYVDDRIAKEVAPLQAQIAEYSARAPEKGEPGAPGRDGKDADPVDPAVVANLLVDLMPVAKDGIDGKSIEIEDLIPVIAAEVEVAVAGVMPKDGEPGAPGLDGKSITVEDVRPLLEEMVSALPPAQNGKDADPVEVAALIIDDVAKLIPVPKDGKDADPTEVAALILEDVAKLIPAPKDGKDANAAEIAALIVDDVAKLIPVPADGKDGKSVTIEDIAPLVHEVTAKRLPNSFLVNDAGILVAVYGEGEPKPIGKVRGEDGLRGASVMDGAVDENGTLVFRMSDGRILQTGIVKGTDGKPGEPGQKGERGRDAHEIQILPGVDEHKTYTEGVVALWRGGVIRSERQTDPIIDGDIVSAGWKVFVRGIADETEELIEDGRYVEKTTVYTDGTEFKRRHKTVTPIYQGVWKDDAEYAKGDEITWAGSSFIALRDNQSEKPEVTDAWRLKTKRGRDGKDGKIDRPPPVVKIDPDKR